MKKRSKKIRPLTKAGKSLRQRRKRKAWEKAKNKFNNLRKKFKRRRPRYPQYQSKRPVERMIDVPAIFNLTTGQDEVLKFFEICKKIDSKICDRLHFAFENVTDIGHGAVTILLSICGYLKDHGVSVSGSYPSDAKTRTVFEKSGFLRYYNAVYSRTENLDTPNEILQRGLDKTNPKGTAKKIREAMKTVFGVERRNTSMQGLLIELMANAVNHAYDKHQKGWYFAVDHNGLEKVVKFCFVDNGSGIINTLKLKLQHTFNRFIGKLDDGMILEKAFNGEFGSRTQLTYRGRGLPAIKKNFENGNIKNLVVISNNVCYEFESGETNILPTAFKGTFYYWELDQTCNKKDYAAQNINS